MITEATVAAEIFTRAVSRYPTIADADGVFRANDGIEIERIAKNACFCASVLFKEFQRRQEKLNKELMKPGSVIIAPLD